MGSWGKRADMVVHESEPFNAEPPRAALAGLPVTPVESFYSRNHGPVPSLDAASWRLRVDGLVATPLTLTLAELRERCAERTVLATLQCAGNRRAGLVDVRDIPGEDPWGPGAISTAVWAGAALRNVLAAAGATTGPDTHVEFAAPDVSQRADPPQPYGSSVPAAKALTPDVLLAWSMNGQPLPAVHGGPVRVVVPGYVGARSVKWVERITVREGPSDNYFQATAYRLLPAESDPDHAGSGVGLSLGPMGLQADILAPDDGAELSPGAVPVAGYAFGGGERSVARVDVSVDGGVSWQQAELDPAGSPWSWQLWQTTVNLPAGAVEITARAWDTAGSAMPESPGPLWNPKGYVNNSWARVRVTCHA
jgi:sulfite oxidase